MGLAREIFRQVTFGSVKTDGFHCKLAAVGCSSAAEHYRTVCLSTLNLGSLEPLSKLQMHPSRRGAESNDVVIIVDGAM
jgi:hypothetical protein